MTDRFPLPVENDKPAAPPPMPLPTKLPLAQPLVAEEIAKLNTAIIEAMHKVFDPEIPVNIYELGLIYDITIAPTGSVDIRMTLTSPGCPVAGTLPGEVQGKVLPLDNVTAVKVDVIWDPPWTPARMSEAAKLQLGMDD